MKTNMSFAGKSVSAVALIALLFLSGCYEIVRQDVAVGAPQPVAVAATPAETGNTKRNFGRRDAVETGGVAYALRNGTAAPAVTAPAAIVRTVPVVQQTVVAPAPVVRQTVVTPAAVPGQPYILPGTMYLTADGRLVIYDPLGLPVVSQAYESDAVDRSAIFLPYQ